MVRVGADGMGLEPVDTCVWVREPFRHGCSNFYPDCMQDRRPEPFMTLRMNLPKAACPYCGKPIQIQEKEQ